MKRIAFNYRRLSAARRRRRPDHPRIPHPVGFASALGFHPDPIQAAVLDPTITRGLLNCTRQWGKSSIIALKAAHRACFYPGSLILVLSPCGRQSGEFLQKARHFLRLHGQNVSTGKVNRSSIALSNHSRIVGLPSVEANIRGFSAPDLILIDEASRVPDPVFEAITPSLAVSGGSLWLLSTPYGKRGFFYEAWTSPDPAWSRFSVPATECPRISAEFLASERARNESWFRQEYLCEFLDVDTPFFPTDLVDDSFSNEVEPLCL